MTVANFGFFESGNKFIELTTDKCMSIKYEYDKCMSIKYEYESKLCRCKSLVVSATLQTKNRRQPSPFTARSQT